MAYLRAHQVPALVKVANLVEHLDLPSTVGNNWMGHRRAACYLPDPPEHPWRALIDNTAADPQAAHHGDHEH
jgi:hypothetical protein